MSGWACGSGRCGSRPRSGALPRRTSITSSRLASPTRPTIPTRATCEDRLLMRDVAVVAFAEAPNVRQTDGTTNGVEMLVPIFREVFAQTGLTKNDIDFWCSGSSDYLAG